jgi:signal transduction histidine kinase
MTAQAGDVQLGEAVAELRRARSSAAVGAWVVAAVTAGMTAGGLLLVAAGATSWQRFLAVGHPDSAIVGLAGGFVGALIVQYRPRNPVGWLLVANAAGHGLRTLAAEYAAFALVHQHGSLPGGAVASWLATPALIAAGPLFAFAFLRFPDGTLRSRPWRLLEAGLAAVLALTLVAVCVLSWPLRGPALLDGAVLPSTSHARILTAVSNAGQAIVGIALILAALSLVQRYRAASGMVGQQMKWISLGAVPFVALLLAARLIGGVPGGVLATLSPLPLLATIAVAIRRYRLYDIDRIISRTVAYTALTVLLAAAFFVVATLAAAMFGLAGGGSPAATAAAAVAVTGLFQPLRRRLQDLGDRRFRRRNYEATRVVGAYLDSLRVQQSGAGALASTLREALADPSAAVAFWLGEDAYVDEEGNAVELPSDAQRLICRVDRAGEHLGVLLLDVRVLDQESRSVLAAVIAAAIPAFDHGRLRAKTLVQLAEVRASRTRILAAADKARRRVEQDLHDGAQQRIVAIGLDVARLSSRADRAGHAELAAGLIAIQTDVDEALHELRELARGIHPTVLTEQGIAAAVESLAERCPVPVDIVADTDVRLAPELEATAYYVVAESLANIAKHAGATRAVVRVSAADDELHIEVHDDGTGGASPRPGSGLTGLRDRVEALGGRLTLESTAGTGTHVVAVMPL